MIEEIDTRTFASEYRFFPFYKGEYWGDSQFGYKSSYEAKFCSKPIPDEDVIEHFGGIDEFALEHGYVKSLKSRMKNEPFAEEGNEMLKLSDLFKDKKERKKVLNEIRAIQMYTDCVDISRAIEFEKVYGIFPYAYLPIDDFKKEMRKTEIIVKVGKLKVSFEVCE